jgi:hypothetical protein
MRWPKNVASRFTGVVNEASRHRFRVARHRHGWSRIGQDCLTIARIEFDLKARKAQGATGQVKSPHTGVGSD